MHFVFQVRALAEIGTDSAGKILERQLHRHLTDDQLEQAWYWIDVAGSLRTLNRSESLPHLLRCAATATEVPLGHFFAAETVCFLGFGGYLRQSDTPLGRAALRLLHRALEGFRYGLPPHVVAEARLGEMIEDLWDNRPDGFHLLVASASLMQRCVSSVAPPMPAPPFCRIKMKSRPSIGSFRGCRRSSRSSSNFWKKPPRSYPDNFPPPGNSLLKTSCTRWWICASMPARRFWKCWKRTRVVNIDLALGIADLVQKSQRRSVVMRPSWPSRCSCTCQRSAWAPYNSYSACSGPRCCPMCPIRQFYELLRGHPSRETGELLNFSGQGLGSDLSRRGLWQSRVVRAAFKIVHPAAFLRKWLP